MKKKLIIFASGTKTGGGSGFEKLVEASRNGILDADIVGVVSNYEFGGVREKADRLGIRFIYFPGINDWAAEEYQGIVKESGAEFIALSGWLKLVKGLDPRKTFNIHPGLLPEYGGKGMYGHHVHKKVMEDYRNGKITHSGLTKHFADKEFDRGPIFFECKVKILPTDTAESLGNRINALEHKWQPIITNKVLKGEISWDGKDPNSLIGKILINEEEEIES